MSKRYYYMLIACFFSEFSRYMYAVVISWILYDLTKNPTYTGVLVSLGFLPGVLMLPFMGVLIDRLNRFTLMLLSSSISAIAIIILILTLQLQILTPLIIFIVHMLLQTCGTLYRPSMQVFLTELFQKSEMPQVLSKVSASGDIGSMMGSTLGGLMISYLSTFDTMFVILIGYMIVIGCIFLIGKSTVATVATKNESIIHNFTDGLMYLKKNPFLFSLFCIMFVGQLVFHTSTVFLSVYTREFLDKSAFVYGFLDTFLSIGGITAGILGGWWLRKSGRNISNRSLVMVLLGLIIVSFSKITALCFEGTEKVLKIKTISRIIYSTNRFSFHHR